MRTISLLLLLLLQHRSLADRSKRLLNAYHAPLTALTSPHSHYFLEFPIFIPRTSATASPGNDTAPPIRPQCEDGSPYSFLFRRGTDEHLHKLLVEFEGASASRMTPWRMFQFSSNNAIPPLGNCRGVTPGFVSLGASFMGFDTFTAGDADVDLDVPIFLRHGSQSDGDGEPIMQHQSKVWWERLGGEFSSVHDWSYIFVPHCTPADEGNITGTNVQHVSDWVTSQFGSEGGNKGLDALVTTSGGGRIGGCFSYAGNNTGGKSTASFAVSFAKDVAEKSMLHHTTKSLAILDGSSIATLGDAALENAVRDALSSGDVDVAWVASDAGSVYGTVTMEDIFLQDMERTHRDSLHVHRPSSTRERNRDETVAVESSCPLYAFSDMSADSEFNIFLDDIMRTMPWAQEKVSSEEGSNTDDSGRLSFLSIVLIAFGGYLLSWTVYFLIKYIRRRKAATNNQQDATKSPPSPHDLWFMALTKFPVLFLIVSIAIPVILSYVSFARNGYTVSVNLDFDTYLDIATKEEQVAMQYRALLQYQKDSLKEEEANCNLLYSGLDKKAPTIDRTRERGLERTVAKLDHHHHHHRGLRKYGKRNGRTVISFFYQNRNGGSVFTPEVLQQIWQFEKSLMSIPGFTDLCYEPDGEGCFPFDSIAPYFFPSGDELVEDIDSILRSFPGSKIALSKMDKYFSKDNLASNVTLTNVMLNDVNGTNRGKVNMLLETMQQEFWDADLSGKYPDLVFSWRNPYMQQLEANDALMHDFKWSAIALGFIGVMIFIKVFNVVAVLAGVLGLVLSFTSAMYWQYHFNFNELTAMHVAGIFVMLGIGADDIFLTIDSFEHTKVDYLSRLEANNESGTNDPKQYLNDEPVIKERMISAYKTAGSMMLVSSVTAAICFFSNVFSAVISIRDFGSYMGMVVTLNYVHVMTILPSALLVNELHIKPFQRKVWEAVCCSCSKSANDDSIESVEADRTDVDCANIEAIPSANCHEIPTQENGLAQTAVTLASTQSEDIRQKEGRDATTPDTAISSNGDLQIHDEGEHEQSSDDAIMLRHTEEMSALDRFFVKLYAPSVYKWRWPIIVAFLAASITLGVLAYLNFVLYDGTIIVFKEKYNLGRVQKVVDEFFPGDIIKLYLDEGVDYVGNNDDVLALGSDSGVFGGTSSIYYPSGGGSSESDESATAGVPSSHPSLTPSSAPTTSLSPSVLAGSNSGSSSQGGTTSGTGGSSNGAGSGVGNQGPALSPNAPVLSNPDGSTATTPSQWYPNWTGDFRGCRNDGLQPSYYNEAPDIYIFSTLKECCEVNFAWDPNPSSCLGNAGSSPSTTSSKNDPTASPSGSSSPTNSNFPSMTPSISPTATPLPTSLPSTEPSISSSTMPSMNPTAQPTDDKLCPQGMTCLQTSGKTNTYRKREYFDVSIVWGMRPIEIDPNVFIISDSSNKPKNESLTSRTLNSNIDPSSPEVQQWLLDIVTLARNGTSLRLHPQLVWIEALKDFAIVNGFGFPIPKELFMGLVDLVKEQSRFFHKIMEREIATKSPGIAGDDYFYTSVSMLSEVPWTVDDFTSDVALEEWTNFTRSVNLMLPQNLPPVVAQSDAFLDSLRTTAIVDSTVSTYFFANGVFLVIVLIFTRNLLLTVMIMLSLILIFLCFGGFIFVIFRIEFGPVESLGVSIFVGLSSNYLLHIAHAYHQSRIKERNAKIQRALFITGSPVVWSAVSTIGGSAFLFACRTWLLTELGILICTVIFLSLIFAMGFLLALLGSIGPLPIASVNGKNNNIHTCDLMSIFMLGCFKCSRKDEAEQGLPSGEVVEGHHEQSDTSPSESASEQGIHREERAEADDEQLDTPPLARNQAETAPLEGGSLRLVSESWYLEHSAEC